MPLIDRRSFLRRSLAAGAAASLGPGLVRAADPAASGDAEAAPFEFPYEEIGRVQPVPSAKIDASPLSVGFEVLDRRRFDPNKAYPHLAKLGVKWARCQTGWNRCETVRGEFDFGWLDEVVDSLLEIGIQPWFNLGYGNKLYTPQKPDDMSVGWAPVFDEAARTAWLRFVGRLAEHFRDRVTHWEIWNEPNISAFWKPHKSNAADYTALVKATAPVIRKAVPGAVIVGGAFAGIPMSYIEGCLDAGLAGLVDKISYHPYRPAPESGYDGEIARIRERIAAHNPNVELWQGENGCPSVGGKDTDSTGAMSNLPWNETAQAKWLTRRILTDLRLDIELTSYFHTVDLVGYRGKTNYKGLLRGTDYTPKPAYFAYQCLCALFDAATNHDGKLVLDLIGQEKTHLQDVGFVRSGRALYAYWYPANLLEPWTPRQITVRLPTRPDATMDEPVLVDPLTSRVFRLEPTAREDDLIMLPDVPLLDYPLLVTDRQVVAAQER